VHPDDRAALHSAISLSARDRAEFSVEVRSLPQGGPVRWLLSRGRILFDAEWKPLRLLAVTTDVTDRRSLEAQLRQAQKMEAVGQLAGGVAHDFNNLLTAILGYARFLLEDDNETRAADTQEIIKAANRAVALTKQLLAFSRQQVMEIVDIDVNGMVEDLAGMLRRIIGEHIELSSSLTPDVGLVRADRGQLEQVVLNLVVNARDATVGSGTVRLTTANVTFDTEFAIHRGTGKPGNYVMLSVSDNGSGMTEDTKARLFEPFFTTKPRGQGTGLGLATAYGIIAQCGGWIWVYSELGRGTTFKVYLPRAEQAVLPWGDDPPEALGTGGVESILLVEDETAVRGLVRTILERAGFTVVEAATPAEAERVFGDMATVDLLVTDVIMPGATGPDLFRLLEAKQPELRVLYMSGYTDRVILDAGTLTSKAAFLEKPFSAEALIGKVRAVLDR